MKKCNHCNAENKDNTNFCHNCGARLNGSKSTYSPNKNIIERFMDANIIIKLLIIIIVVFLFLLITAYAANIFLGFPLEPYSEGDETYRSSQFNELDTNGDGALSYDEIKSLAPDINYNNLTDIFNSADKNDNGVLKGAEFDGFIYRIENYYKDLEKQKTKEKNTSNEKNSSSSSKSNPIFEAEGHESCPYCGSDQLTEFYNEYYDEMDWICDDCGEIMRDDDEMDENYWKSQGVKWIFPSWKITSQYFK